MKIIIRISTLQFLYEYIFDFSYTLQILFKNNKVDGVKVIYKNGSFGKIDVRKEVILCAGTVNTPQLLLISGIGPANELKRHKVVN